VVGLAVDLGFLSGVLSLEGGDLMDAAAFAHRADLAGTDLFVLPLGGDDGPGFSAAEAARVMATVRKRVSLALRGTRLLDEALALRPAEVLFLSETGGPVGLDLRSTGRGPLAEATAKVRASGAVPVISVPPDEKSVLAAQDAGALVVEIAANGLGHAATDDQSVDGHRRVASAARAAADVGMRVRACGGACGSSRASRLAEVPEVEQIRVGPGLLAGSFYEGVGAAVDAFRREIARGARRGERGDEEE
jgi:pyridoxine 5'-phosphate synthase PdxJ